MLPPRAYPDTFSAIPSPSAIRTHDEERPSIVIAAGRADLDRFPAASFTRLTAHTTADASSLIERMRPRVVAVDWDVPDIDAEQVLRVAGRFPHTRILVATAVVQHAPAAIRSGCHALLLKPFARNLAAARIGRLCRELPISPVARRIGGALPAFGTHRVWPDTRCPTCGTPGATSFEFSSYRRMWYACLGCDAVWLGPRQE
jgi:DNA-binding response OmpR family regulator